MKRFVVLLSMLCACIASTKSYSQDSLSNLDRVVNFPTKLLDNIDSKAKKLEDKVVNYSEKALVRLERQELKLRKKLAKKDSLAAKELFGDVEAKYKELRQKLKQNEQKLTRYKNYIPGFDTLKTSLNFISQNSKSFLSNNQQIDQLRNAITSVKELEGKLQGAEAIRKYLRERKAQLKEQLAKFGLSKELEKYNKQAYYYSQQIKEYQAILTDPEKLEKKALELITKLPAFKKFFSEHSELAQLFQLPDGNGTFQSLAGLQTRSGVQSLMQRQLSVAGPNANQVLEQGIQQAQAQINKLKDKVNELGGGSGDIDMPDFKNPNSQKTKSFWKRLEFGTDLQNSRGSSYLPITTDLGLSISYNLSDRNSMGFGASYKMGWGKDIRNITITHEGVGLRSFLDLKLKGSFFITGGYEQNYHASFDNVQQLRMTPSNWLQSGLIGLKKKYSIGKKSKGSMQLMFDFLYKSHAPQTQPVLFRLGYGF